MLHFGQSFIVQLSYLLEKPDKNQPLLSVTDSMVTKSRITTKSLWNLSCGSEPIDSDVLGQDCLRHSDSLYLLLQSPTDIPFIITGAEVGLNQPQEFFRWLQDTLQNPQELLKGKPMATMTSFMLKSMILKPRFNT